jgi:DNA processing protein
MDNAQSLIYKIALSLMPKVGPVMAKRLIAYTGSPEAVFKESEKNLLKIPNLGKHIVKNVHNSELFKKAEQELQFIEKYRIEPLFYTDKSYPNRLKNCEDSPILIYSKGRVNFNAIKVLSVVGTRHATELGLENCQKLIRDLTQNDKSIVIVSGLAYGIDICAHKSALDTGVPTVGVLAHGLNMIYPSLHRRIAEQMTDNGALVTEFSSHFKAIAPNFVSRNRIIAGLADATVVVESAKKGGALITADIANSYNRDVFAFPGRSIDKFSQGCNKLIKTHKAALIENAEDLEYVLGWEVNKTKQKIIQRQLFSKLSEQEKTIVGILEDKESLAIDEICAFAQIPTSKVSPLLLELEFKGLVKTLPGKRYKILSV